MIETILNLQELQNFSVYIEYRYCKQSTEDFSNLRKELGTIDKNLPERFDLSYKGFGLSRAFYCYIKRTHWVILAIYYNYLLLLQ